MFDYNHVYRYNESDLENVNFLSDCVGGSEKSRFVGGSVTRVSVYQMMIYFDDVYLVTALVPSLTACLASSPGKSRRTAVWISRLVMVDRRL